ncbi:MAG: hypothetical protein ACP6IT_07345, partial [Candidatus Thorarchaeota archaeon]
YEILLALYEDDYVRMDEFTCRRRTRGSAKIRRYFVLLQDLQFIREHEDRFTPGNAFVSLREKHSTFDKIAVAVFSEILKHRYAYLRDVVSLGNLERIVRIANIIYYDELHAGSAVPRTRETLLNEFELEYETSISPSSMRTNLYKLRTVEVVQRSGKLYHGVTSLRERMMALESQIPSPEAVWSIPAVIG